MGVRLGTRSGVWGGLVSSTASCKLHDFRINKATSIHMIGLEYL